MKVLVIGSGGREHSICKAVSKNSKVESVFVAPGNAGTKLEFTNVDIGVTDFESLSRFVETEGIGLTIVGPEVPLSEGIVDYFTNKKQLIFGPNKQASQLEASKAFSKNIMTKYGIPTANYQEFSDFDSACKYVAEQSFPQVIKADGLAAGKGVTIAESLIEAEEALKDCFINTKFGDSGSRVVIESFLTGEEASVFVVFDDNTYKIMGVSQDHKQIYDNDKGPNTGGMGAYSPAPLVTDQVLKTVEEKIIKPMFDGLKSESIQYKGVLYVGLMIDQSGEPSVVEFNVRLGDPETQVVLPRLKSDFLELCIATVNNTLADYELDFYDEYAVGVVLAAKGYPDSYPKGDVITNVEARNDANVHVIHAGTTFNENNEVVTNGGRVLCAVASAKQLEDAISRAYQLADSISYKSKYYRTDIAAKALKLIV